MFVLSKIFWLFVEPLTLCIMMMAFGLALLPWRRRLGYVLACTGLALLAFGSLTNVGSLLMAPLEADFSRPVAPPEKVDGIIVLGGGFDPVVSAARQSFELAEAGDRYVEALRLARLYPDAKIVVSGGVGALGGGGDTDAVISKRFFEAFGISPSRLLYEGKSRNTYENGLFTKQLLDPQPGQTWLLVTSAFHMPRSIGIFRKLDFPVVPWPVDYRTAVPVHLRVDPEGAVENLRTLSTAVHEWIGLVAYRIMGRTADLFPR